MFLRYWKNPKDDVSTLLATSANSMMHARGVARNFSKGVLPAI